MIRVSVAFQRRIFEWTPYEKSTLLLVDFSDYGNGGARVSPGNGLTIYIAPAKHSTLRPPRNRANTG